jgi:hypothetical protein
MSDTQLARDIGEIKGLLKGVHDLVAAHNNAMNRRIDDLHQAVTQRLNQQSGEIAEVRGIANTALTEAEKALAAVETLKTDARKAGGKSGGAIGAAAGGVIGLGVELIKYALGG